MRLRAICPIPTLESLSELQRQQAAVIARNIAPWMNEKEMARRGHSALFISTLEGLAALEILFPLGAPDLIFPLLEDEARKLREAQVPSLPSRFFRLFNFGSEFYALAAANDDITPEKRAALRQREEQKNVQIFLQSWHFRAAPSMGQGETDAYSWNGELLKVLQRRVAGWIS
ncbi:MAG: hypothetical protein KY445_09905 [Armatimonadetes bacterium]|nr:hypothetical protein [Armatimonadota bacterium]